jgi:hypothetical protein
VAFAAIVWLVFFKLKLRKFSIAWGVVCVLFGIDILLHQLEGQLAAAEGGYLRPSLELNNAKPGWLSRAVYLGFPLLL